MSEEQSANTEKPKLIWDIPIRVFHWLLVLLLVGSWYTVVIEYNMDNHMRIGYAILALLIFRVVWGFIGPKYSRFSSCIYSPKETIAYLKTFFTKKTGSYAGHNPLGSIAIFALVASIMFQAVSGLFATDDFYVFGPFSYWVSPDTSFRLTSLHYQNFDLLVVLGGVHIVAVFYYLLFKRENLITAMFTGRKNKTDDRWQAIKSSKLITALVLIIASAIAVYALVEYGYQ